MNLIVVSHMYPYEAMPYNGIFVKEQLKAVRKLIDGKIYVISPVPWAPRPLRFRDKWRWYSLAEKQSTEGDINVLRPRYLNLPGIRALHINCYTMFFSVKQAVSKVLEDTGREDTLVHSHALLPDGLAGGMAARKFGLKSLCTLHGSDINIYPHYSNLIYRDSKLGMAFTDSLIAVSGLVKKRALEILPDARVDVITNGVNTETFKTRGNKKTSERRIIFVGRLTEDKGVKELLKAFAHIYRKHPDTRLVLIGEPVLREWISGFIRENALEKAVEMTGGVPHETLPEHYGKGHLFVLPSYSEGMPVSMLEAMAMGLPVVISAVGGVPEIIRHGENGLLVKPRSVDDIVEKVSLLLENPDLARKIKETALSEVRSKYTWDASANMLVAKYKSLLNQG
jgi:teichuronic acid biosynthesis glycosyltransferase TuaC